MKLSTYVINFQPKVDKKNTIQVILVIRRCFLHVCYVVSLGEY